MKLDYTDGYVCFSTSVDGVELADMGIDDVRAVIKKLVDNERDMGMLQKMFMDLLVSQGEYEDLGECDECGDFISAFRMEI